MQQKAPSLKDCLIEYVENITALKQKMQSVRESQQAVIADLMLVRQKCQALRLQLSRQGA